MQCNTDLNNPHLNFLSELRILRGITCYWSSLIAQIITFFILLLLCFSSPLWPFPCQGQFNCYCLPLAHVSRPLLPAGKWLNPRCKGLFDGSTSLGNSKVLVLILGVPVRVFLDGIQLGVGRFNNADCSPQCGQGLSTWLKVSEEQKGWCSMGLFPLTVVPGDY